jgi:hypothetical protein
MDRLRCSSISLPPFLPLLRCAYAVWLPKAARNAIRFLHRVGGSISGRVHYEFRRPDEVRFGIVLQVRVGD